jgi:spermidine synthase
VKPSELLGQTISPDGTVMKLIRRSDEYIILADGAILMSSRMHGSEEEMATLACQRARTLEQPSVLIGGLGMGFTLRATLDVLSSDAMVVVAELVPAVVEWNRGPLGPLAGHPLKDKRVRVETADVAVILSSSPSQFDAVLLDVDNGPTAVNASNNAGLYDNRGIAAARTALKMEGVGVPCGIRAYRAGSFQGAVDRPHLPREGSATGRHTRTSNHREWNALQHDASGRGLPRRSRAPGRHCVLGS